MKANDAPFLFLGYVIGSCVTRIYYEGPGPWQSWAVAVLVASALVAAWGWLRRKRAAR